MIPLGVLAATRSASAWTPANLPGLALWLDANDAATVTITSGRVSQWADKSPNGTHVTQSNAGERPTVLSGSPAWPDRTVLRFDGAQQLIHPTAMTIGTGNLSFWGVFRTNNPGWTLAGKSWLGTQPGRWGVLNEPPVQSIVQFVNPSSTSYARFTDTVPVNTRRLVAFRTQRAPGITQMYFGPQFVDASDTDTLDTGAYVNHDRPFRVGRYDGNLLPLTGEIAELIGLQRRATDEELADVYAYLSAKWGL